MGRRGSRLLAPDFPNMNPMAQALRARNTIALGGNNAVKDQVLVVEFAMNLVDTAPVTLPLDADRRAGVLRPSIQAIRSSQIPVDAPVPARDFTRDEILRNLGGDGDLAQNDRITHCRTNPTDLDELEVALNEFRRDDGA